ncbi:MAG TPA: helix-turn-helix transcriptional regulator [Terriglobales bacterium]|nr:helix-turn-helix transcriptional regulator [Terriglobales bacterium]
MLVSLRRNKKLSQEKLSELMDVHRNTVVRLEKHPDGAHLGVFLKAAEAMDVPAWKILRYVEEVAPQAKHKG